MLDTQIPGQRAFQALLFEILHTPAGHVWDGLRGRSLNDLLNYMGWVAPQPDRLVIDCTLAPRVASHLLPHVQARHSGATVLDGIPGLRVNAVRAGVIELVHLPTGGRLDLRQDRRFSAREFRLMLADETDGEPAPRTTGPLGRDELHAYDRWTARTETDILSALMVRASLFWCTTSWHRTTIGPSRRSDCTTRISWRAGLTATALAHHLIGSAVGIPGAHITEDNYSGREVLLTLGTTTVELDGPYEQVPSLQRPTR